jgi:hypothetical protein
VALPEPNNAERKSGFGQKLSVTTLSGKSGRNYLFELKPLMPIKLK